MGTALSMGTTECLTTRSSSRDLNRHSVAFGRSRLTLEKVTVTRLDDRYHSVVALRLPAKCYNRYRSQGRPVAGQRLRYDDEQRPSNDMARVDD